MARHPRHFDEPFSTNSLLDVLTNVVAILTIFIVVTLARTDHSDALPDYSLLPDVTEDQVIEKRDELANLEAELGDLKRRWGIIDASMPQQVTLRHDLAEQIGRLRESAPDGDELKAKQSAAQKKLDALTQLEDKLDAEIDALTTRNGELTGKLAQAPAPIEVRLPVQGATPDKLDSFLFICRYGEIFPLEFVKVGEVFNAAMEKVRSDNRSYNAHTFVRYFNANDVGDKFIRVTLEAIGDSKIVVSFVPRQGKGESMVQALERDSEFQRNVRSLDPKKRFVQFYVHMDSLSTYVQARRIVEEIHSVEVDGGEREVRMSIGWMPRKLKEEIFVIIPRSPIPVNSDRPNIEGPDNN